MYQKWVRAFAGSIDSEIMSIHSKNRRALRLASGRVAERQAARIRKSRRKRSGPPALQHLFQSRGGSQPRYPRCIRGSIVRICQEVQITLQLGRTHYTAKINLPHNPLVPWSFKVPLWLRTAVGVCRSENVSRNPSVENAA
jgi:hypothetical protein